MLQRDLHRFQILLLVLMPLCLALALYWPMLSLPYFWDDLPTFQAVVGRSIPQIWGMVYGLSYYRPLTFTIYKLFFSWSEPGVTVSAHLFMVFVHAGNGVLVGLLGRQLLEPVVGKGADRVRSLGADRMAGLMAALLFVAYPFAALPISHFAALVYPLATLFMLGTTVAVLQYARGRGKRWLILAIGLALLAPYVHEEGVMAGWVAALAWVLYDRFQVRRHVRAVVLLLAASSSFLLVWLAIPRNAENVEWIGGQGILASATFFLQGPTFPLQLLSRQVSEWLAASGAGTLWAVAGVPWWALGAIWLSGGLAFLLAAVTLRHQWRWRLLAFAVGWTFLTTLPSIAALPFSYITVSQRLLYYSGPAAAVLWAAVCVSAAARLRVPGIRVLVSLALVLLILGSSVFYVVREVTLHQLALRPLAQLAEIARQFSEERHLVINPVNWVNYRRPWYVLGHEGVSVAADYIDFGQLVRLNSGNDTRLKAATFSPIKADTEEHYYSTIGDDVPWDWATVAAKAPAFDRVWVTSYSDRLIAVEDAGSVRAGEAEVPEGYLATFSDDVFLLAGSFDVQAEAVTVTLEWKYLAGIPGATVFRHLSDCDGNLLGQADGFALDRVLPFDGLEPGAEVRDVQGIAIESPAQDGCYTLGVGLFLPDGTRVSAVAPDGHPFVENVVPLSFD
jgi:hypothetical protein